MIAMPLLVRVKDPESITLGVVSAWNWSFKGTLEELFVYLFPSDRIKDRVVLLKARDNLIEIPD
jgi:hypothetical protein